jgi:hypothetical protein
MLDFIIIGCQKCGTTVLKHNLKKINGIYIPNKEIHFFNSNYDKGIDWYESHFQHNKRYINGEKTPNYITDIKYLEKIYDHYPDIKLIAIFRNPILRALSHWNHFNQIYTSHSKNWGWSYENSLMDSLQQNSSILTNGNYFEQLRNVYQYFNKKNVYIMFNEYLRKDMNLEFNKLCDFIGIKNNVSNLTNSHERQYQHEIFVQEIKFIIDYYKLSIEKFYQLIGYRIDEWDKFIFTFKSKHDYIHRPINNQLLYISSNLDNLTCLITCVNYSDFLKITLPENKKIINNILVLTNKKDKKTIQVCKDNDVNYIATDIFFQKSPETFWKKTINKLCCYRCVCKNYYQFKCLKNSKTVFQKSKAINMGIKKSNQTEWILLLDADIIIPNKFNNSNLNILDKNTLYGVPRIVYKTQRDWITKKNAYFDFWKFMGFFQLFNINSSNFHKKYFGYNEEYNYANEGDYHFAKKWTKKELLDFYVIHLGETGENWQGRVTDFWN